MSALVRITAVAVFAAGLTATPPLLHKAYAGDPFGSAKSKAGKLSNPFGGGDDAKKKDTQPPVTAGGLYTKDTYPVSELQRPLTITDGLLEVRAGIDADLSSGDALGYWRGVAQARYGVTDTFELQGGFDALLAGTIASDQIEHQIDLGFESAIDYNLVDFRLTAEMPVSPDFKFDIATGFPIRYEPKPNIAIIALDKLLTIHTDGNDPDLTLGVGAIFQALPNLAVLARGELTVPGFDPSNDIKIPVTADVQFTPRNTVDLGLEVTLVNLKPSSSSGLGALDQRLLLVFGRFRM